MPKPPRPPAPSRPRAGTPAASAIPSAPRAARRAKASATRTARPLPGPTAAPRRVRRPGPGPESGPGSHERIFTAALAEFATRGVAGARVDRIAASAGLNKAMLYYHFGSKDRLYRAVIQHTVGRLASSLESVVASDGAPEAKLDLFIERFVTLGLEEPHFAPVMLREIVEGASRIDAQTISVLLRLVGAMGAILSEGKRAGVFRAADPLLTYLTTAWPIMVYLSTDALRRSIVRQANFTVSGLDAVHFIAHMQDLNRRMLAVDTHGPAATPSATTHTPEHAS